MEGRRKPNILVVSFRPRSQKSDVVTRLEAFLSQRAKLLVISMHDEYSRMPAVSEALRHIDGVVVLGSSDLFFDGQREDTDPIRGHTKLIRDALRPLVEHVVLNDFPTFAFCFGHQLIAHCMGSPIVAARFAGKVGTFEVETTRAAASDTLFEGIPQTFNAHYGHTDVVAYRPENSTLLAYGRHCHNAMLRYGYEVYTSQFHPELDTETISSLIGEHENYQGSHFHRSGFVPAPYAEQLVVNFVDRLQSRI